MLNSLYYIIIYFTIWYYNLKVHYYEDGNVQLMSSKEINKTLSVTVSIDTFNTHVKYMYTPPDISIQGETSTAKEICKIISTTESEYQVTIFLIY